MTIEVNHDWFAREVKVWYDRAQRLNTLSNSFDHASLPALSEQVGKLSEMIPALNTATSYMVADLYMGAKAAKAIADRVAEAGRQYGLSEEERAAMAKGVTLDD